MSEAARIQETIRQELIRVARRQETITYGELADKVGLHLRDPNVRWRLLPRILDGISTHENREGRPLLSVVVVRKDAGYPGPGFFEMARSNDVCRSWENELDFFVRERKRAHEYWKSQEDNPTND